MSKVINCAHRGASGHAPENTIAAVEKAIALGADMTEIDLQQTIDDRFAVFHDDLLDRTSSGTGPLWRRPMDQLAALDAGSWFGPEFAAERIPALEDVLDLTRDRLPLNLELKLHGREYRFVELAVRTLRDLNFQDHAGGRGLVTSFDHEVATALKDAEPDLTVGAIFGREQFTVGVFTLAVDILSVEKSLVDEDFMDAARRAGKQVHVWTVNEPEDFRRLIDLGVDAVITNFPDRFPGPQEGTS